MKLKKKKIEKKGGQKKQIHRDEVKKKEYVGWVLYIGRVLKLTKEQSYFVGS